MAISYLALHRRRCLSPRGIVRAASSLHRRETVALQRPIGHFGLATPALRTWLHPSFPRAYLHSARLDLPHDVPSLCFPPWLRRQDLLNKMTQMPFFEGPHSRGSHFLSRQEGLDLLRSYFGIAIRSAFPSLEAHLLPSAYADQPCIDRREKARAAC